MLQDNCLSPHYLSTFCSSTICTLLRSSCSSLVVLGDHTEELPLCRAVCITSVINWILPRADFVEYFFLLFLRLDHLRSNLLGPPFYEQLQMLREIKCFPQFPIITQRFCSPQFYHSIFSKTPILIFCLWAEKLFSPSPSSCHLLLLFFENWWNSHQPWVTNQLPCFLSLCQFSISFGYLEGLC